MKTLIKNSVNGFGLLILLTASICWTGCEMFASHTDPLAGWQIDFKQPDPAIDKDSQDYMQKLPSEEKKYASWGLYYKDGTGQHAVQMEVLVGGKNSWDHYLFYDKNNKRIKVEKYYRGSYWNP